MNKGFRQKYKTILENKIVNLQEMRLSGGWGRFLKLLDRMPSFKDMFRGLDDFRQWVVLRRLNRMEGRTHRFLFSTSDSEAIRKLNSDYPQLGGWIKQLIITEDGAHLIPFGHNPIRYWYLPGPGKDPILLPPTFNPHIHDVPGHVPWVDNNGNINDSYEFPVLIPLGLGVGGAVLLAPEQPASADPYNSPSNLPGWHPPMLPPPGGVPTPPWYSPLAPMDPSQPNFGIPGY
jgi:hypothetical protein